MDCPTQTPPDSPEHDAQHLEAALRIGQQTLATWSSTQKVLSLSSAESECCSMVGCASETVQHGTSRLM